MRVLYVGDPHVVVSELKDGEALVDLVAKEAYVHQVDAIVFLGDQYHHHGIVHLEVMDFWMRSIEKLLRVNGPKESMVYLMVGNHDKPGNGSTEVHALLPHKGRHGRVIVVDFPQYLAPGVWMVPHRDTEAEFLRDVNIEPAAETLVCHQTFNGGRFENGFYAKDGFNPEGVPQPAIISGHIHLPQSFGKVKYLGSPRWRTASDANIERHIWVVEHDETGKVVSEKGIPTGDVCRRIWDLMDDQENPEVPLLEGLYDGRKDDVRVTVRGDEEYLKTRKGVLTPLGFKVRTIKTGGQSTPRVKESEGIGPAFQKFLGGYQPRHGTSKDILAKLAQERLANVQQ